MSIEYKVKETSINPHDSVIEKHGQAITFTIGDIDRDVLYLEKAKKELEAQMKLEEAKKSNVVGTHPHIAEMSEEDRVATYLYQQAFAFCKVAESKIKQITEQIESYGTEKEEILKQTGIVLEVAPEPMTTSNEPEKGN